MDEVERKSVMLDILYEDKDILVVVKPAGVESQTSRRLEPDMVSEIKNYLHRKVQETKKLSTGLSPKASTAPVDPYVGVIHRLDKPVRGVMVYAKNLKAATHLSRQVQEGKLEKIYQALVCGKPVDNVGNFVDYLLKDEKTNVSKIVDKGITGAKKAELSYEVLKTIDGEIAGMPETELSLVRISLRTGRHHQIRVQMAHHGTPLYGDMKYGVPVRTAKLDKKENADQGTMKAAENRNMPGIRTAGNMGSGRESIALCASSLTFFHPVTKKEMTFEIEPVGGAFQLFQV